MFYVYFMGIFVIYILMLLSFDYVLIDRIVINLSTYVLIFYVWC